MGKPIFNHAAQPRRITDPAPRVIPSKGLPRLCAVWDVDDTASSLRPKMTHALGV